MKKSIFLTVSAAALMIGAPAIAQVNNSSDIDQVGNDNVADVDQAGTDNSSTIDQDALGAGAFVDQSGSAPFDCVTFVRSVPVKPGPLAS